VPLLVSPEATAKAACLGSPPARSPSVIGTLKWPTTKGASDAMLSVHVHIGEVIDGLNSTRKNSRICRGQGDALKPALTDDRGLITVKPDFDIGETINNLWTGSRVKLAGWRVRVSAPGYSPCTSPLFVGLCMSFLPSCHVLVPLCVLCQLLLVCRGIRTDH
jgi:hypothetical protein